MKFLLLSSTIAALFTGAAPAIAAQFGASEYVAGAPAFDGLGDADNIFERQGRGRGRSGDDDRKGGDDDAREDDDHRGGGGGGDHDDDDHGGNSDDDGTRDQGGGNGDDVNGGNDGRDDDDDRGRGSRVPGGSGCDDPEDLLEHPECVSVPLVR